MQNFSILARFTNNTYKSLLWMRKECLGLGRYLDVGENPEIKKYFISSTSSAEFTVLHLLL